MSYNIPLDVETDLKSFFSQFTFIEKVFVFGSRARKDNSPKSDIDLAIFSSGMNRDEFTSIRYELNELPILYKMDLVHFEKSNETLQSNILKDGKLLFSPE